MTVDGEIRFEDWSRLDQVLLSDLIDDQGNLDIVVDLCDVTSLDQAAGPLIVHAVRRAHRHGGRLRLADRACRDRRSLSWERSEGAEA